MEHANEPNESTASTLCKSCGLCCTGHLFAWTKLRSPELKPIEDLGVRVFREPHQRGFNQPCPLWDGVCTVYTSPDYPRFCKTYKCKLLKELIDEKIQLSEALTVVKQIMEMIEEVDALLPDSSHPNFRDRLVEYVGDGNSSQEFRLKA
ncbi:MAG: YkgJ family cysteine cluster protein, partial [Anaerolineales bacterium]|nr:YkgJ family cysteine cluster protein [Anaerolineales bacterium]